MAKRLKLNIKNTQIADAIDLHGLKAKLAKKKSDQDVQNQEPPVKESKAQELVVEKVFEPSVDTHSKKEVPVEKPKAIAHETPMEKAPEKIPEKKPISTPEKAPFVKSHDKVSAVGDSEKEPAQRSYDRTAPGTGSERPPYQKNYDRTASGTGSERPPYQKNYDRTASGTGSERPPYQKNYDRTASGTGSERPPYQKNYDRTSSGTGSERPPYQKNYDRTSSGTGSERPPYQKNYDRIAPESGSERPPYQRNYDRASPGTGSERPPYQRNYDRTAPGSGSERPPYQKNYDRTAPGGGSERPPYQRNYDRAAPGTGSERPPYQRNYDRTAPGSGSERPPYQKNYDRTSSPGGQPREKRPFSGNQGGYQDRRPGFKPAFGQDQDRRPMGHRPAGGGHTPSGYDMPYSKRPKSQDLPLGPVMDEFGVKKVIRPATIKRFGEKGSVIDEKRKSPERIQAKSTFVKKPGSEEDENKKKAKKEARFPETKGYDARLRRGLAAAGDDDEAGARRRKRHKGQKNKIEQEILRPTAVAVRLPISIKDLAVVMKRKASELISKLFLQGITATLNDFLTDEVIIQIMGEEFGCAITINTSEEDRIRITSQTIREEIAGFSEEEIQTRPPVIAFMGHVDHGKTSLIDAIRKTNRVQGEAGAITQHIGAFQYVTSHGPITILDTPGHEAFSQIRERGAKITDIVVLVVAGDDGIKEQTLEAIQQAKSSDTTIVVAINKCDKPSFDQELVYRQLADRGMLPEAWGGQTLTVNCSAVTGEGIKELLELVALQAEILELTAVVNTRARGTIIETEMHKGLGPVATVLVQNGTLNQKDCLVFGHHWARIKTMRDENDKEVQSVGPSTPVVIDGLSGFPDAGEEFIVVANEKEARSIAGARQDDVRQNRFVIKRSLSVESMVEDAREGEKKTLNVIIRADTQGSAEALRNQLEKIISKKALVNVVSSGIGTITESDVRLAVTSSSVIIGFHSHPEAHADAIIRESGVRIILHDIIYKAVDEIRAMLKATLDKLAKEVDKGVVKVITTFKASTLGIIAGCQVSEGSIMRSYHVRLIRNGVEIWRGPIASLKRHKDDVKEVQKGFECGILLQGFTEIEVGDILQSFETIYIDQDL